LRNAGLLTTEKHANLFFERHLTQKILYARLAGIGLRISISRVPRSGLLSRSQIKEEQNTQEKLACQPKS
jgi:hypothetical protein